MCYIQTAPIGMINIKELVLDAKHLYRVSSKTVYTWLFALLSASSHAKCKSWDVFLKIWEICYMIGTRILKFDLEIAEIIEIKVATFNMEIIFLPL